MSSLVITDAGIWIKSFQELRAEIKKAWIAQFGDSIDLSPTSIDGHQIDLECKTITSVSQLLQSVINNLDPSKATGVWLDILGDYKAMERIKATYSVASVTFSGAEGTVVPAGTIVRYDGAPCDFTLMDEVTIGSGGSADGKCRANAIGNIDVFVGEWKMVSSTPSGVTCEVNEANSGGNGLDAESDAEFRARQKSYAGKGLATYDRMCAYMASVVGEDNFTLGFNDEDVETDGIPPHRFEFLIKNGVLTNDEVAQAVWHCKPGGIKPFGNTEGVAIDRYGRRHTMYFSRPVTAKLWVVVDITDYDESLLPENYEEAIETAVTDYAANSFAPGMDVNPKQFYGPIYENVKGLVDFVVKTCVKETEPDASEYSEEVIVIGNNDEVAVQKVTVSIEE